MKKLEVDKVANALKVKKVTDYDFSISYKPKNSPVYSMPRMQYHTNYEIHFLLWGERTLLLNNQLQYFNKGDLLFIRSNDMHRMMSRNNTNHQRYMVEFKPDYLSGITEAEGSIDLDVLLNMPSHIVSLDSSEQKEVLAIMESIHTLCSRVSDQVKSTEGMDIITKFVSGDSSVVDNYEKAMIKFKLIELLIRINTFRGDKKIEGSKDRIEQGIHHRKKYSNLTTRQLDVKETLHSKIPFVIDYIHSHYHEALTVDKICELFFVSKSYFCLIFKEMTGMTFIQYLNEVRIKEAKHMISSSRMIASDRMTMGEVAIATGYNSSTHFGRIFKQITGYSPMAYRKEIEIR